MDLQSQTEQKQLLDLLSHALLSVNLNGEITFANKAAESDFGYAPGELIGKPVDILVPPDLRDSHKVMMERFLAHEHPVRRRLASRTGLLGLRKDGSTFPVEIELSPSPDHQYVLATIVDVTDQLQARKLLEEIRTRLLYAQRVARMGFWEWDIQSNTLYWSEEIYVIFGLEPFEFGASYPAFLQAVHPDDRELVEASVAAAVADSGAYSIDHRIVHPGGEVRYVHEQGEVTRAEDGTAIRMVGTVLDITDRKLLEEKVVRSQRMDAFGQLAGGIAHDFNNLLTVIGSYASLLERGPANRPRKDMLNDIEQIQLATDRAAQLTGQLLAFARRSVMEHEVLSLTTVVLNIDKMLRRLLGANIELVTIPTDDIAPCLADPAQLEQILLNLAINAGDAMSEGGKLTISTENVSITESSATAKLVPGRYACVLVSDTGTGMDQEVLGQIFEPFFTTKDVGKGTGLGLATCAGIVSQLNGSIQVESEVGQGTTFRIYLPAVEGTVALLKDRTHTLPSGGSETILVAEDDSAIRALLLRLLRGQGYTVIESENGEAALAAEDCHDGVIDLLISDIIMPRMGGRLLREEFTKRRPDASVLFISGYSDERLSVDSSLADVPMLAKPFMPDMLLTKVRVLLDERAAQSR